MNQSNLACLLKSDKGHWNKDEIKDGPARTPHVAFLIDYVISYRVVQLFLLQRAFDNVRFLT